MYGVNDGLKTTFFRNLLTQPSRPVLVGVKANPGQACSSWNACGIHSNKKEALAVNLEENAPRNIAKPWCSNRQLSTGCRTMLRVGQVP